jgi:hypothetical protein
VGGHFASALSGRFENGRLVLSPWDAWGHFVAPCVFLALGATFVMVPDLPDRTPTTLAGIGLAVFGAWWMRRQWRALRVRKMRIEVAPEVLRRHICTAANTLGWRPAPNPDPCRCDFVPPMGDYKYLQEVRVLILPGEVQFVSTSSLLPGVDGANMARIAGVVNAANAGAAGHPAPAQSPEIRRQ